MKAYFRTYIIGCAGGAVALIVGIVLAISSAAAVLPWVLIGLGCGAFFGGLGGVIASRMAKKNAEFARTMEIELADERNNAISNKAKAGAHDFFMWAMWAVLIFLAAAQVQLWITLTLVGVQLARMVVLFVLMARYRRSM
jgi:hypothetical protein